MSNQPPLHPPHPFTPPPPNSPGFQPATRRSWFSRNWGWVLGCGCLSVVVLGVATVLLFFYGVFSLGMGMLKDNDVYRGAVQQVQNSPEARELLGSPIEPGYLVSGSISVQNTTGKANLTFPVSGPKGDGTVNVQATRVNNVWTIHSLVLQVPGQPAPIVIVGPEKNSTANRSDVLAESPVMTDAGWEAQATAMAKCFRNLAAQDFGALLDIAATPACRKGWDDSSAGLFSERIEAAAFFDTAFFMVPECSRDSFTVAAYNMYINSAIVARYEKEGDGFKIHELKAVSIGDPELITERNSAGLEKELRRRLTGAAAADYAGSTGSVEGSQTIRKALREYLTSLRVCFSPQSTPENKALKGAVLSFLEACGRRKPDGRTATVDGIDPLLTSSWEWRSALRPVFVRQGADSHLVAFSSTDMPGKWLFTEFAVNDQTIRPRNAAIATASTSEEGRN